MGRDGLSVIEKTVMILERFVDERAASLTFNEVLAGTPLHRATAHRLLSDMVDKGLLAQDAQREEYRFGPLLLSICGLTPQLTSVAERALPRMEMLRDQFGETMVLAELHQESVVPVRRVDGSYELRMNQEIGHGYPAYAGATGKVLLAHLDSRALTRYLASVRLEALTETTVTSIEGLRLDLETIRRLGVGVSRGERVAESIAVAAPIFNRFGDVECTLTLSGVASRFDRDRMLLAAQAVKDNAAAISLELGYVPARDEPRAEDLRNPDSDLYHLLGQMCDKAWGSQSGSAAGEVNRPASA